MNTNRSESLSFAATYGMSHSHTEGISRGYSESGPIGQSWGGLSPAPWEDDQEDAGEGIFRRTSLSRIRSISRIGSTRDRKSPFLLALMISGVLTLLESRPELNSVLVLLRDKEPRKAQEPEETPAEYFARCFSKAF